MKKKLNRVVVIFVIQKTLYLILYIIIYIIVDMILLKL